MWIMGFSYERGEGEMLESYGHRCESILSLTIAGGVWDTKRDNPWNVYTSVDREFPGESDVGSIHYAPNSDSDYEWGDRRYVETHALDWRNYPDLKGTKAIMNCDDGWGPDIAVHHKWWLGLLPKAPGKTKHGSNNWWTYIADVDGARYRQPQRFSTSSRTLFASAATCRDVLACFAPSCASVAPRCSITTSTWLSFRPRSTRCLCPSRMSLPV